MSAIRLQLSLFFHKNRELMYGETCITLGEGTLMFNATDCAKNGGRHAFGVDQAGTARALRRLANDIETGVVVVHSVCISSRAAHEEFTVRELVIEVLEETANAGPRVVKS
jgi:hypothetical protein